MLRDVLLRGAGRIGRSRLRAPRKLRVIGDAEPFRPRVITIDQLYGGGSGAWPGDQHGQAGGKRSNRGGSQRHGQHLLLAQQRQHDGG